MGLKNLVKIFSKFLKFYFEHPVLELTSLGSMTAHWSLPNFPANFAAIEHPPAPPPTTTNL